MKEQADMFDICASRHGGNEQSREANPDQSVKGADRAQVFNLIRYSNGITSKEIAKAMGRGLNCISGRISELKRKQKIAVNGSRDGCGILFAR